MPPCIIIPTNLLRFIESRIPDNACNKYAYLYNNTNIWRFIESRIPDKACIKYDTIYNSTYLWRFIKSRIPDKACIKHDTLQVVPCFKWLQSAPVSPSKLFYSYKAEIRPNQNTNYRKNLSVPNYRSKSF